jgi:hypothetical protein
MAGRTTAVRAAAERRARDFRAQREAERRRHEAQVDAALADFFEGSARADQIKRDAAQRAAVVVERAEVEAAEFSDDACRAIRRLRDLGQTNAEISDATGLSVGAVRAAVADVGAGADSSAQPVATHGNGGDSAAPAETADKGPITAGSGPVRSPGD